MLLFFAYLCIMIQQEIDKSYLRQAIALADENVRKKKGGPFAAIIVKDNQIIATGTNLVTANNDPTAHAEVTAIRNACSRLGTFQLQGCTVYASCEPCPMCLGAIYWARPSRLVFAADKYQASSVGFDDSFIYKEIKLPISERSIETIHILMPESNAPMDLWRLAENKKEY